MLRRTADDVGLKLPMRVGETIRWIKPGASQQTAYAAAEKYSAGLTKYMIQKSAARISGSDSSLID